MKPGLRSRAISDGMEGRRLSPVTGAGVIALALVLAGAALVFHAAPGTRRGPPSGSTATAPERSTASPAATDPIRRAMEVVSAQRSVSPPRVAVIAEGQAKTEVLHQEAAGVGVVAATAESGVARDVDNAPIAELPVELLLDVRRQMLESGRSDEARKLESTYDFKTGRLKTALPAQDQLSKSSNELEQAQ